MEKTKLDIVISKSSNLNTDHNFDDKLKCKGSYIPIAQIRPIRWRRKPLFQFQITSWKQS